MVSTTDTFDTESLTPFAIQKASELIHFLPVVHQEILKEFQLPETLKGTWTEFILRLWTYRISKTFDYHAPREDPDNPRDLECLRDSYLILHALSEETTLAGTPQTTIDRLPHALISIAATMEQGLNNLKNSLDEKKKALETDLDAFQEDIKNKNYQGLIRRYPHLNEIAHRLNEGHKLAPSCKEIKDQSLNPDDLTLAFKKGVNNTSPYSRGSIDFLGPPQAFMTQRKNIDTTQMTHDNYEKLIDAIRELGNIVADRIDQDPVYTYTPNI